MHARMILILVLVGCVASCSGNKQSNPVPTPVVTPNPTSTPSVVTPTPSVEPSTSANTESVTRTIEPTGGVVALSSGLRLEFPSGALGKACDVTVKRVPPSTVFTGKRAEHRIVLDIHCPEKLLKPAQIRLPLPKPVKPEDANDIIAGQLEPGGSITVSRGATIEPTPQGPELVVRADHFSVYVIVAAGLLTRAGGVLIEKIDSWINPPPEAVDASRNWVPAYYQGGSLECLSTSLQMACKAVKPDAQEIWQLMKKIGIARGGISPAGILLSGSRLSTGIKAHSGIEPDIFIWGSMVDVTNTPYLGALKRYIMRTLNEGIPVVFTSSEMKDENTGGPHAVILLGYDRDGNFYGINPQHIGGQCKIVKITQKYMGVELSLKGVFVTMALPNAMDVQRPRVTMNVLPNSAWFGTSRGSAGPTYMLTWDGSCPDGIGWRALPMQWSTIKDAPVSPNMPPEVTKFQIGYVASENSQAIGGVDICNIDDRDHSVSVTLQIQNITKGTPLKIKGQDGMLAEATVEAHKRVGIPFEIPLGQIMGPDTKEAQQFELRLSLFVEGTKTDSVVIPFTIDVLPTIATQFSTQIKTEIPGHGIPFRMSVSGAIKGPQNPKAIEVKASDKSLTVVAPAYYDPTSVTVQVDYTTEMKYRVFSIFVIDKVNTNCQVDITLSNARVEITPKRKEMKLLDSPGGLSTGFQMPFKDGQFGGSVKVMLVLDQKIKVSRPVLDNDGNVTKYELYKEYTQELYFDAVSIIAIPPKK